MRPPHRGHRHDLRPPTFRWEPSVKPGAPGPSPRGSCIRAWRTASGRKHSPTTDTREEHRQAACAPSSLSTAAPCAPAAPSPPRSTTRGRRRSGGKARSSASPRAAGRLAVGDQRLRDRPDGERARHHDHAHLRQGAVPGGRGARAGEAAGRVARDRRRPPEPFLEEMVGQVLQAGLDAPIVFAGDEDEGVGAADLAGQRSPAPRGAAPFGYSLYMRSSIGRPIALASISSTSSPRARRPLDDEVARGGCPSGRNGRSRRRRGCGRSWEGAPCSGFQAAAAACPAVLRVEVAGVVALVQLARRARPRCG